MGDLANDSLNSYYTWMSGPSAIHKCMSCMQAEVRVWRSC